MRVETWPLTLTLCSHSSASINSNRVSLKVVRQEVMQVMTIGLKITKENKECKTVPTKNY
jgi:hypothetical protein